MRSTWLDGDRIRNVEVQALGGGRYRVVVDESELTLEVEGLSDGVMRMRSAEGEVTAMVTAAQGQRFVRLGHLDFVLERLARGSSRATRAHGAGLESPMPGVVTRVMVAPGDKVKKGQPLMAVEAMKMEHLIRAPHDGTVRSLAAAAGAMVAGGVALVELEGSE